VVLSTHSSSKSRRGRCSLTAVLAGALSFGAFPEVPAACKIEQISELHVEMVAGSPMIDGQVNGQAVRMLLETGSVISYLTIPAAHQFKLPIRQYAQHTMYGANGNDNIETANVKELRIGELLLKDHVVNVANNQISDGNGVASFQLGADLLSHFATEFDLAHGVVRLLHSQDCKLEQLAYWGQAFSKVELEEYSPQNPEFILNIKVNGKEQEAKLVSGSARSYISLAGAKDAGIEPSSPGVEPAEPFHAGSVTIPTWAAHFDTIELGGETIKNARLHMGDVFPHGQRQYTGSHIAARLTAAYQIKLGSDFFQAHRLLIVPDQKAVLFTYNRGAVF
jgi:gag-polyprotein putative aspartyl protease